MGHAIEMTLSYRQGVQAAESHVSQFREGWNRWCAARGFAAELVFRAELGRTGRRYWTASAYVPAGSVVPHLDKAGLWPHGMTQVVRFRGQAAALQRDGLPACTRDGRYACSPEFLTHSRSSAPDAFGGSQ